MQNPTEARQERDFHGPDGHGPRGELVTPAAKARQGLGNGRMLVVLSAGVALLLIAFAASYVGAV